MSVLMFRCTVIAMKTYVKSTALLLTIFLFGAALPLLGASPEQQQLPYGIGVQFSPSIWGLSYHRQFEKHAIQGTVGISYDPDPLWDSELAYGASLDYQRNLYGYYFNEYLGARLYGSTSIAHSGVYDSSSASDPFEAKILFGAGFGVEVLFFKNFSLPLEIVYEFSYAPTQSDFSKAFAVDLVPKVGLRFRFT